MVTLASEADDPQTPKAQTPKEVTTGRLSTLSATVDFRSDRVHAHAAGAELGRDARVSDSNSAFATP